MIKLKHTKNIDIGKEKQQHWQEDWPPRYLLNQQYVRQSELYFGCKGFCLYMKCLGFKMQLHPLYTFARSKHKKVSKSSTVWDVILTKLFFLIMRFPIIYWKLEFMKIIVYLYQILCHVRCLESLTTSKGSVSLSCQFKNLQPRVFSTNRPPKKKYTEAQDDAIKIILNYTNKK